MTIRTKPRHRPTTRIAYASLAVAVIAVLGFAVLGVRDTLSAGASIPYRIAGGLLRLAVLAFATIGVLDTLRGSALKRVRALGGASRTVPVQHPMFRRYIELFTGTPLAAGHDADVMTNGDELYPRLFADLRAARRSVVVQLYYCEPGRMADEMLEILADRARSGIPVFVLVDAFGAEGMPGAWFEALASAGAEVARFRPVHWYSINRLNNRSHVRAIAIDGLVGYTGGFGLADKWYGDGRTAGQWRDTTVRFTGPAVAQLLAAFAVGWAEATGELLTAGVTVPDPMVEGDRTVTGTSTGVSRSRSDAAAVAGFLHTPPTLGSTRAERFLSLSIAAARERLYISNAYFVPNGGFRGLLEDAARRGVDVRVLTAGPVTDVRTILYGGRARYMELLSAGVRIYEYQPAMMHAKTLVVDGRWVAVGSMNFDNRSMVLNDEANFVALDVTLGERLEAIFAADVAHSDEITLEVFRRRPAWHRVREWLANLLTRVL